jgi:chemotaxis response regulator CheB
MPGAVAAAGLASAVLPLAEIPRAIVRRVEQTCATATNARLP